MLYALHLGIVIGAKKENQRKLSNAQIAVITILSERNIVKIKSKLWHLF